MSRLIHRVRSGENATPGQQQGWTPVAADGAPYADPAVSPAPPSPRTDPAYTGTVLKPARKRHGKNAPQPVNAGASDVPVNGSAASPPAVQVMPLQLVQVQRPAWQDYLTAGVSDIDPIYSADGAMIPATAPGSWGQLRAAGRA